MPPKISQPLKTLIASGSLINSTCPEEIKDESGEVKRGAGEPRRDNHSNTCFPTLSIFCEHARAHNNLERNGFLCHHISIKVRLTAVNNHFEDSPPSGVFS